MVLRTMYDYLDRVLKPLVSRIQNAFRKYRTLPFDELNVLSVYDLYRELDEYNREAFREIAQYYYRQENESGVFADNQLSIILQTPSRVMKYAYESESIRKRDRFVEAMIASESSVEEIDRAMRIWAQFTGWFAIEVADAAVGQARRDMQVEFVVWKAEHDDRTCTVCHHLDGEVFETDAVPPKPHPGCRCWTEDAT